MVFVGGHIYEVQKVSWVVGREKYFEVGVCFRLGGVTPRDEFMVIVTASVYYTAAAVVVVALGVVGGCGAVTAAPAAAAAAAAAV